MTKTSSELKTEFVRWLDLLNKPRKLFLWKDELFQGLSGKSDDHGWMRLGWGCVIRYPCIVGTLALHLSLAFIHESCQIRKIFNQHNKTKFHYLVA